MYSVHTHTHKHTQTHIHTINVNTFPPWAIHPDQNKNESTATLIFTRSAHEGLYFLH